MSAAYISAVSFFGEGLRSPLSGGFSVSSSSFSSGWLRRGAYNGFVVRCSEEGGTVSGLGGVEFEPFELVKNQTFMPPIAPRDSLARYLYFHENEAAVNHHINVEYSLSYVYHAMYAYFDRDNIALKGLAKFFKELSEEKRQHAEKLIEYQNIRGGTVKLHSILMPLSEFDHAEKGDALYSMEITLSLEKITNDELLSLHKVASVNNDPQMEDFIESKFLTEQVEVIKKISEYVAQLRMVGKGHGVWHFDQMVNGGNDTL